MRSLLAGLACCAALSSGTPAKSQTLEGFALDRFEPAPAGDRFFGVQGGRDGTHGSLAGMLLADYAYRPLVLYESGGDDRVGSVVSDQMFLHAALAVGLFHRLTLSANAPFALVTSGDSPSADGFGVESPSGAALGDLRLGARVRVLGEARGPARLAAAAAVWLPTGNEDRFAGHGGVRFAPSAVASGELGMFSYASSVSITLAGSRRFGATELGNEIGVGAAAALSFLERLQIGPELTGSTALGSAFERGSSHAEGLLGAKLRAGSVVFGAGAGPGFTRGLGTPTLRAVAGVTLAPEADAAPRPRPAPSDRDGDGIWDPDDACPDQSGVLALDRTRSHELPDRELNGCPDRDQDGVFDVRDACPAAPGVAHDDPKKNGCPKDTDADGIPDAADACPGVAGAPHDDPKRHGCPKDTDADGIPDAADACPGVAGVASDDPAKNGCPKDTDGDTIVDPADACPTEKGPADPDPGKHGCPTLVRVTERAIVILQQVKFKTASADILPESDELLTQVATVLREHPEITKVEIQGHTDNRGGAEYNRRLSQRRAASVAAWLTARGKIDASRLEARGYGMDQPLAENTSEDGRHMNRRVEFKIVAGGEPAAAPHEGASPP